MNRLKIGFVGVGAMGQCAHLRNYATLPECEVVALAELRSALGQCVARRYGVPRVYRDHREMLAGEALDGIVASQPYNRHGVLLPELFAAGVPVFTEKPLTCSLSAGQRILDALRSSSARHFLGYHKRSDPATVYARSIIDGWKRSGEMGALRYVRILMPAGDWIAAGFTDLVTSDEAVPDLDTDAPPADMDADARRRHDAFVNYYIHQVNLMRHLLGERYAADYADPSGVVLAIRSESGVPGVIEMSPYQTTTAWQEEALIAFERGYIRLRLPAPLALNRPGEVEVYRDGGAGAAPEAVRPELPWVHAMRQQAIHFLTAVRGEPTPLCEAEEAYEDLAVARAYMRLLTGA